MNRIELICHRQAQRARRESGQPFGPGPMAEVAVPVLPWRLRWKNWSVRYLPHLAMAAIILILLALAVFGAMGCDSHPVAAVINYATPDAACLARIHAGGFGGETGARDAMLNAINNGGIGCSSVRAYKLTDAEIAKAAQALEASGHFGTDSNIDPHMIIGRAGWYSSSGEGSFGMYVLYQPALEQAKRSWWIHGTMRKGSQLLTASANIRFDESVIGHTIGGLYDVRTQRYVMGGAVVIAVIDQHTVKVSSAAPDDLEQWQLGVLPSDYQDMCACHIY